MAWEYCTKLYLVSVVLLSLDTRILSRDRSAGNRQWKDFRIGKNKLQEENFHEPNRWKPPVRLKPFDAKLFSRFHVKEVGPKEGSGAGSGDGLVIQCDDEDNDCEEGTRGKEAGVGTTPTVAATTTNGAKTTAKSANGFHLEKPSDNSSLPQTKEPRVETNSNLTANRTSGVIARVLANKSIDSQASVVSAMTRPSTKSVSSLVPRTTASSRISDANALRVTAKQIRLAQATAALSSSNIATKNLNITVSKMRAGMEKSQILMTPMSKHILRTVATEASIASKIKATSFLDDRAANSSFVVANHNTPTFILQSTASAKATSLVATPSVTMPFTSSYLENVVHPTQDMQSSSTVHASKTQGDLGLSSKNATKTEQKTSRIPTPLASFPLQKSGSVWKSATGQETVPTYSAYVQQTSDDIVQSPGLVLSTAKPTGLPTYSVLIDTMQPRSKSTRASRSPLQVFATSSSSFLRDASATKSVRSFAVTSVNATTTTTNSTHTTFEVSRILPTRRGMGRNVVTAAAALASVSLQPDIQKDSVESGVDPCLSIECKSEGVCKMTGQRNAKCHCPIGKSGKYCEKDHSFTHPKFQGDSYMIFQSNIQHKGNLRLSIEFRPDQASGLLIYAHADSGDGFLAVLLLDGYAQLRVDCGKGFIALTSPERLALSTWHRITVRRFGERFHLQLDESLVSLSDGSCRQMSHTYDDLYLGGLSNSEHQIKNIGFIQGFSGCVKDIRLEGRKLLTGNGNLTGVHGMNIVDCTEGHCLQDACSNSGACLPSGWNSSRCHCHLGYSNSNCSQATNITIPEFSGSGFLQFNGLKSTVWSQLDLEMVIKPKSKDGLILYNGDKRDGHGDFVLLAMRNGSVELRFDCGTGEAILLSQRQLVMHKWYHIKVTRRGKAANLTIDNDAPVTGESKGPFKMLKLREPLFIGGADDFSSIPITASAHTHFKGCIEKIKINNHLLPWGAAVEGSDVANCRTHDCLTNSCSGHGKCESHKGQSFCHCYLGYSGRSCEREDNIRVPKFNGHSFLKFQERGFFKNMSLPKSSFSLEFKSNVSNGLILWKGQRHGMMQGDFISLSLLGGNLVCRYNLGGGDVILRSTMRFDDGEWHRVWLLRNNGKGEMRIDETVIVEAEAQGNYIMLNSDGDLYLGGADNIFTTTGSRHLHGLEGCIRDVRVGDSPVDLNKDASTGHHVLQCT